MKHNALILATIVAAGCKVGPNYEPPRVTVLDDFGEQKAIAAASAQPAGISRTISGRAPVVAWWQTFHDPILDDLIARAADQNLTLRAAESRLREARALRRQTQSALFPLVNVTADYEHVRPSQNGVASAFGGGGSSSDGSAGGGGTVGGSGASAPGAGGSAAIPSRGAGEFDLYQAGFDASWEIDVFGRAARAVEGADARVQASLEDRRDVLLSLMAEVAREYVTLRELQHRLQIAQANLAAQSRTRELIGELVGRGLVTNLDLSRAEAQVATTESSIPPLRTQVEQAIHRIGVLLAEQPAALSQNLSVESAVPGVPDEVPIGLPFELLRRRPDIRRAERQLAAATADVGVATADLFPRFTLNGSFGLQSVQPGDFAEWASRFFSFGPSLSYPLFDAGRRRAQVTIADARRDQAMLAFQQQVLVALREVEDALIAYRNVQSQADSLRRAVAANQQTLRIANDLYRQGVEDFLSVLDAQRGLLSSQDALATAEGERATQLVALYKSLGGGWEPREFTDVYGPKNAKAVVSKAAN